MVGRVLRIAATVSMATVLAAAATEAEAIPQPVVGKTVTAKVGWHPRFRFTFDKGESLRPSTRVVDVTGNGHYGVVQVSGPGRLKIRPGHPGKSAGYPRKGCRRCGRAIIKIQRNGHLNPRRHAFAFGASVRVRPRWAKDGRDPNIVQKGLYTTKGSQWKLQLVGAEPSCVFNGRAGLVNITSPDPIDDGNWHQLVCRRVGTLHTLVVDGLIKATATVRTGAIANTAPVTVGGRAVGTLASNDQFHGNVDNVFLKVGTLR